MILCRRVSPSGMDGLGVDATIIRAGLLKGGKIIRYTLSNSSAEATDVVAERNPRAFEFDGQRWRLSTPTAPSSLTYFCINSIVINERALISRDLPFGLDTT